MIKQSIKNNKLFKQRFVLVYSLTNDNVVFQPFFAYPNTFRNIYFGCYCNNITKYKFGPDIEFRHVAKELYKL